MHKNRHTGMVKHIPAISSEVRFLRFPIASGSQVRSMLLSFKVCRFLASALASIAESWGDISRRPSPTPSLVEVSGSTRLQLNPMRWKAGKQLLIKLTAY